MNTFNTASSARISFNTNPVLDHVGGVISAIVMAGLTLTSAATMAMAPAAPAPVVYSLPAVVITAKRATPEIASLPAVIVTVKRAAPAAA
jgi:hypothetical protein